MLAQSAPPSCPASRPVDDIIAEIQKEQSKSKHRNATPFPQVICSWGWCLDVSRTPPTIPEATPEAKTPRNGNPSLSPTTAETCDEAMEMALQAAHNVEVGDYSFGQKNYKGALLRYNDALEQKPDDLAIHVRMGRVLEKLKQVTEAIEQYKAAQKLAGPERWSEETRSALLRLQHTPTQ